MKKRTINSVDDYLSSFSGAEKKVLSEIRQIIRSVAPKAEEKISYGIPTFYQDGNLVHFGGSKKHLGFYPGPSGIKAFEKELGSYITSKGAIQLSYERKLPVSLIKNIVKFRLAENEAASQKKPIEKTSSHHLPLLSKPATRALLNKEITSLKKLCEFTRQEILSLHGMGPASMPAIEKALKAAGFSFKK